MRLYLLEGLCLFAERGEKTLSRVLSVTLPKGSRLTVNGTRLQTEENGAAHVPAHQLREGENDLVLEYEGHLYPTEGLFRAEGTVTVLPLRTEQMLNALAASARRNGERIEALEKSVSALLAEKNKKTLFS